MAHRQPGRQVAQKPSSFKLLTPREILQIMPSKIPDGETRGWIVPIGGAENKENDRQILERFVRVSGGSDANIVVIPTASRMHETGPRYEKLFSDLGAAEVAVMDLTRVATVRRPDACEGSRKPPAYSSR